MIVLPAPRWEKYVYMGIKATVLVINEEDVPETEMQWLWSGENIGDLKESVEVSFD